MNNLKRFLALVLAMSMLLTVVPFGAFAAESDAAHMANKPADSTTTDSPFIKDTTGGSTSFRIPVLTTLSDGTLVAAADARWDTCVDGGGLDTIVARSSNDGADWSYTFANYMGDNGNEYNGAESTCFIDPAMAVTSNDTIYMLCDLYPYGVALNGGKDTAPQMAVGFDTSGRLLLSNDDHTSYGYYLENGKIYAADGTLQSGYTVDAWFNLTGNDCDTNLFFSDSPFKVVRTGYLYLTKSTNKGATWSEPTLLNLKKSTENVCLVGPGRGLVTESGTIVFPVYSYTSSKEETGLVYSVDNGTTWVRGANLTKEDSSEAALVELDNGNIRAFFRNHYGYLYYADYDFNSGWTNYTQTSVKVNSNTQLSAIEYSRTVNGDKVILVSCPTGPNANGSTSSDGSYRTSGKIFAGILNDDNSMTWKNGLEVTPVATSQLNSDSTYTADEGFFGYSCMTELKDGSVAILYEDSQNGWESGYFTMAYKTYTESELETAFGVTFDGYTSEGGDTDDGTTDGGNTDDDTTTANTVDVTLKVGETVEKTINGVSLNGSYTDNVANVTWVGSTYATATLGTDANYTGDEINVADCLYTFTKNDAGNWVINRGDVYLNIDANSAGYPHATTSCAYTIEAGNETGTFYIRSTSNNYLYFDRSAKNWNRVNTLNNNATWMANCSMSLFRVAQGEGSGEIYGYERVTDVNNIGEGQYLIGAMASDNNWYIAYPSTDETTRYNQLAKVTGNTVNTNEGTEVTVAKGQLLDNSGKVDLSKCLFTFTDHETEGYFVIESASVEGRYLNNIMDDASATVPFSATAGKVAIALGYTDMFQFTFNPVSGSTYGNGTGSAHLHFHTEQATPYWNRCGNDTNATCYEYLYRAVKTGEESSTEIPGYIRMTSLDQITSGGQYLIAHTNGTNYYVLYPGTAQYGCVAQVVTETATVAEDTTAVTIKGVAPGYTEVKVGTTQYNITVNSATATAVVDVELKVGETKEYTEASGAYTTATTDPNTSIAKMELNAVAAVDKSLVEITDADYTFDATKQYVIVSERSATEGMLTGEAYNATISWSGLVINGLDTHGTTSADTTEVWTITANDDGTYAIQHDGKYLTFANANPSTAALVDEASYVNLQYSGGYWYITNDSGHYLSNVGGFGNGYYGASGFNEQGGSGWKIHEVQGNAASTEVSFTGVSAGKTVAVVGNTQYNITVKAADAVNVNLEVGESLTYTDTTGNYVDSDSVEYPNEATATMTLAPGKALKAVTTLESGKQYLIVNKATGAVLTDTEMTVTGDSGNKPGLATTGTASADSKELWTFTAVDGDFYVTQNEKYLAVAGWEAHMYETAVPLTVSYTDNGWLIYDYTTGPALGHYDAGYYLSDNIGSNYVNGALGTSDTTNTYRYWEIYEIVETQTEITFTGKDVGTATAKVGSTTYYITVDEYILDDEINDSSNGYTVNAELQRTRYNELIKNVAKDLYTDESWPQYESARKTAYALLNQVDGKTYATEAEAQAAINELIAAIDALEAAKAKLVDAETITIHYQFEGNTVLTEEYKVAADAATLPLPDVIVVDKQTYTISENQSSDDEDEDIVITDGVLTLPENDTVVYVAVEKGVVLGNGLVASRDINADGDYAGTGDQVADLIKDDGTAMKITEMTLTTGVTYDLNLADTLADGQTVTWTSSNKDAATVDEDGLVTPVAAGTTTITATIKDADGNIVSVNSIPVTVFARATTNRLSAVYVENIDNTTVYCVVNADTDAKAFEVIEGELIYGYFDTTADDNTATTAFSFFGDPDEAHALVAMTSTNSFGDYYLLHDDDGNLGIGTQYYRLPDNTTGAGYWQAIGLTDNVDDRQADWTKIEAMINWAIQNGCDGGMGFTRRVRKDGTVEGNIGTNLTFTSDPMPKIEKEVYGVLPTTRKMADFRLYTDGMVAAVNELVYFKITVTLERPTTFTDDAKTISAITYDEAFVKDTILKGAYLYTKELDQADGVYDGEIDEAYRVQIREITDELNVAWGADETVRTKELYLLYEIQESDIPKFYIDNIAYLNYHYESHYSTGAQAGAADAEARISVVGTGIDNVVIDFGQSVVYTGLENVHLKGVYVDGENDVEGITASKGTAKYGDVSVTRTHRKDADGNLMYDDKDYPLYDYVVTYTPNQILHEVDTVLLYGAGENNQEKIINGFLVYPATTVYYEEGFILSDGQTWDDTYAEKATVEQTFELLGRSVFDDNGLLLRKDSDKTHAYGFDPIYDGVGDDDPDKSFITSSTGGATTSFTFTGNGFELFADCTTDSGSVSIQVKDSNGKYVKVFNVNTVVAEENTAAGDATDGQDRDLDSLPIVSWHTENHDTYTVYVKKIADKKPVTIDGVRVFNTLNEADYATEEGAANSPFAIDLEDAPEFYQLRDYVLDAITLDFESEDYQDAVDPDGNVLFDRLTEQIMGQISGDSEEPVATILAGGKYDTDAQNLLDNGPKNELYLHQDETLVFNVQTSRAMQIGLKAPGDSTNYSLEYKVGDVVTSVASNRVLYSSVDLFYELGNTIGTDTIYTITITNHGTELLSVTDLKICDDPNAAFVPLTAEDIKSTLVTMGYGVAENTTTGSSYATVTEALNAAQAGETVRLLTDCTDSTVMVAPGITLDLNGCKLTASYAVALDTAHIIDNVGTGSLTIGVKSLVLDEENAMIPVYNGEGYVFTKAGFAIRQDGAYTGEGIRINALAYPVNMAVVDLLKDGGADNNIEIVIRLTWDTDQGTGSQDFKFTDAVVGSVYSSNDGTWSGYSKMFSMVVTGFESIESLKANMIVVSGTDAEYVSSTSIDIT